MCDGHSFFQSVCRDTRGGATSAAIGFSCPFNQLLNRHCVAKRYLSHESPTRRSIHRVFAGLEYEKRTTATQTIFKLETPSHNRPTVCVNSYLNHLRRCDYVIG